MKKYIFALVLALCFSAGLLAQPGGGTTSFSYGGTSSTGYSQSSGTNSVTSQTYTSTGSDENVVQVTGGTLTMTNCTLTKTGDTETTGDETSFYGVNSSVFAGNESTSTSATITMTGGTITSTAKGANGIFAYGGGVINVSGVTIYNNSRASRGLIATGGGTIIGDDLTITTCDETSSVIATDRGGGTVTVSNSSLVCQGNKCAIIYSAGTMTATGCTGSSALGEIADIEGDNSVTITDCEFSCSGSSRGLLMMQSGSGDASGTNPVMTITNSTLTMTNSSAPLLEVATCVTATCTLDGCTLNIPSGILMAVIYDDQWDEPEDPAVGNLILANGEYTGLVYADDGYTANVTVNSGATWNLTANTTINTLVNNGTIVTNGYTLTCVSMSGSGSIVESGSTTSYTITATANPTAGGTVSGAGTYTENTACTLVATANSGYTFTNWTLNDEVVSTSASYSFTVSADADYVANFEEETPTTLDDNCVTVVYNGTTATVTVADNIASYLTVTQSGAHVSIAQSDDIASEITYTLSGSSTDGEFYMSGSYKATIELNGLTLTNATPVYSGAAVHIQNGKRINVKVITGTTNTLEDAASGSQKGCLYVKGHAEFKQSGTLNVVGNVKHGIKAGEYITIKNATINVTSAVGDGISCNEYFLMQSGTVSISGTGDDGIQADLDGTTSTGMTTDHEDEDSGNVYISGGTITITCPAVAAKGIKSAGDMYISGSPVIDVTTSGDGEWDEDDLETKAACGISSDGNIDISGGTLILTATGSGGKGMKCDNLMTISGGDITVETSGGLYYNDGTTVNTNYTGDTDNIDSDYYSSPKGIKAGTKTEVSTSYTYAGGLIISGGTISVTTSGHNAEGIESKNTFDISGGEIYVNAYDDALNSAQDLTITGGYVYAHATNNDGMDANGDMYIQDGLVYAIGASSPELAIDVNSEEQKQLYFTGGTLIAIGGLESGSVLNQTCYQVSSVSSNTWYSMTYGSNAIAFLTPTISSGGGPNSKDGPGGGDPGGGGPGGGGDPGGGGNSSTMVISASSTPTLKSGVTVSGGTSIFDGKCYVDATFSGGSTVSTSQYSSGGSGTGSPSYRFNIAGNWNTASNWSTGTVPGSSATVTINADCQLDTDAAVTDLTVTTSKVLTIGSGQTLTVSGVLTNTLTSGLVIEDGAQLVNATEGVQATAQKTIEAYTGNDDNYYLIASPMTESLEAGNVTDLLSNDYDLYLYDQSETLEWRNYKASEFTTIDNTKGYLYANSSAVTLNFAGTLHPSGTETVDVEYDGSADIPGWNLIGNPFACNAYLGSSQAFYKMGTDGTELEAVDAGTAISPLEGVFVETTANGSVTFSTTATRGAGSLNVRVLEANGKALDNAIVSFGNGGMLGKFMLKENATKVYLPQNGKDYAVVCSDGQGEMTVSFKAVKNGNYTLSINAKDIDMDYLHLIDNITGNDIDLLAAGASTGSATYTFEAKTTDYASRFRLVFNANESADEAFAFFNGSEWVVSNPSTGSGTATLQVIDMMGRIVSDMTVSGSTHISLNVNPGLYVMRLIDGGNTKTQKIIIN